MHLFATLQSTVFLLVLTGAFAFELVAFIDAMRYSDEVYRAAGKRSKTFWAAILGIAALLGFLAMPPLRFSTFLSILGFVAAAVYFVDVRKALRSVDPRYRNR